MRVLVSTVPQDGHFNPLVPLARAIRDGGHEVAVATSAAYGPEVESAGLPHVAAGIPWLRPETVGDLFSTMDWPTGGDRQAFAMRELFVARLAPPMHRDLLEVIRHWKPDVLLRDAAEFGALLAANDEHLPCAATYFGNEPGYGAWLTALEALPPVARASWLDFVFTPRSWGALEGPAQPTTTRLAPPLFDRSGLEPPPSWLDELVDPVVYVTMGTAGFLWRRVLKQIIAVIGDLPIRAVVTVSRDSDPERFAAPPNVRIERYVPQSYLFPRCQAIVCHGGFGTLMGGLAAGIPVVVVPTGADHFVNAERCEALGLGRVVSGPDVDSVALRDAIQGVLGDPAYRARAQNLAREIKELPPVAEAVPILEGLVNRSQRPA